MLSEHMGPRGWAPVQGYIPQMAMVTAPWPMTLKPDPLRPSCPRPWWRLALGLEAVDFDATLGYPGEGPQLRHSTPTRKSNTLTLITANVTSWVTGTDAGVLDSEAKALILQKVKLRDESLRAARSEARKEKYHGNWAPAKRVGPCGPTSGGLATLVAETKPFRSVAPEKPGTHWREGRWTHTAIGADGTQVHIINVYGWPLGTPDKWRNQNTLWKEMFSHVAGLGDVPWITYGKRLERDL